MTTAASAAACADAIALAAEYATAAAAGLAVNAAVAAARTTVVAADAGATEYAAVTIACAVRAAGTAERAWQADLFAQLLDP